MEAEKMAQITQVKLVDDLDGGEAAESVSFSLDVLLIDVAETGEFARAPELVRYYRFIPPYEHGWKLRRWLRSRR